jgi:hypothetical protein
VRDVIRKLPIPVVGVPWYLAQHLPDSPVVCHEVGHVAEQDFGLTEAVEAALEGADIPDERRPAWRSWLSEVFADVYGCLGAGSAFVSALMGFLVDDPAAVAKQKLAAPGWGKYPTTDLRMAFNFAVLRRMKLDAAAGALEQRWAAYYGGDRMSAFRPDCEPVAEALLCSPLAPLGNVALAKVLAFDQVAQRAAEEQACDLLAKQTPDPADARRLHASVHLAFAANPETFAAAGVAARALNTLWDAQDDGVRGAAQAAPVEDFASADEATGADIYDAMRRSDGADAEEEGQ